MSTAAETQPVATLATGVRRGTRLGYALQAEWTKLGTVPGPAWLLIGVAVLTVAVSTAAVGATHCPQGMMCPVDTTKLSLTGVQFGQAVVAILAVLVISDEYSTGMIRVTLAAMPARHAVLAAKAILVAALVVVAGAVAVFGSVLAGHLILPGHGFTAARGFHPVWLSYGPALRAASGSVLYLALISLLSLGVAVVVRDSAVAIGTVLALLPDSACWHSGPPAHCSPVAWRSGYVTPEQEGQRLNLAAGPKARRAVLESAPQPADPPVGVAFVRQGREQGCPIAGHLGQEPGLTTAARQVPHQRDSQQLGVAAGRPGPGRPAMLAAPS